MAQATVKKVCGNCKHWGPKMRHRYRASRICEVRDEIMFHYCYCPLWELNTRVVPMDRLKKFPMEK